VALAAVNGGHHVDDVVGGGRFLATEVALVRMKD